MGLFWVQLWLLASLADSAGEVAPTLELSGEFPFASLQAAPLGGPGVLVLGDSHVNGTFGVALSERLRAVDGSRVRLIGSCGRWSRAFVEGSRAHCGVRVLDEQGVSWWGRGCKLNPCGPEDRPDCEETACRTPRITDLTDSFRPDLVVVNLGGNSMFRGSVKDGWKSIEPWVDRLVGAIHSAGSRCLWVTPAHGMNKSRRKMKQFSRFLRRVSGSRCEIFDSDPSKLKYLDYAAAAKEAGKSREEHDLIHYDRLGEAGRWRLRKWSEDVSVAVATALERPRPSLAERLLTHFVGARTAPELFESFLRLTASVDAGPAERGMWAMGTYR